MNVIKILGKIKNKNYKPIFINLSIKTLRLKVITLFLYRLNIYKETVSGLAIYKTFKNVVFLTPTSKILLISDNDSFPPFD